MYRENYENGTSQSELLFWNIQLFGLESTFGIKQRARKGGLGG